VNILAASRAVAKQSGGSGGSSSVVIEEPGEPEQPLPPGVLAYDGVFVTLAGGEFQMGQLENTAHNVTLSKFAMAKYETTFK